MIKGGGEQCDHQGKNHCKQKPIANRLHFPFYRSNLPPTIGDLFGSNTDNTDVGEQNAAKRCYDSPR